MFLRRIGTEQRWPLRFTGKTDLLFLRVMGSVRTSQLTLNVTWSRHDVAVYRTDNIMLSPWNTVSTTIIYDSATSHTVTLATAVRRNTPMKVMRLHVRNGAFSVILSPSQIGPRGNVMSPVGHRRERRAHFPIMNTCRSLFIELYIFEAIPVGGDLSRISLYI